MMYLPTGYYTWMRLSVCSNLGPHKPTYCFCNKVTEWDAYKVANFSQKLSACVCCVIFVISSKENDFFVNCSKSNTKWSHLMNIDICITFFLKQAFDHHKYATQVFVFFHSYFFLTCFVFAFLMKWCKTWLNLNH